VALKVAQNEMSSEKKGNGVRKKIIRGRVRKRGKDLKEARRSRRSERVKKVN
jgi:hypothetical protein